MPKPGWDGNRPIPGLVSVSQAHLFADLAALAATDADLTGLTATDADLTGLTATDADLTGLVATGAGTDLTDVATAVADADPVVPTTVSPGMAVAGVATPMIAPSDSRRNAVDGEGTIPILVALTARLAGDSKTSRDWLRVPSVSVSASEVVRRSCNVKEP